MSRRKKLTIEEFEGIKAEGIYLVFFVFFVIGIWAMLIGIHNMDQGRNLLYLIYRYDGDIQELVDCSLIGCVSIGQLHSLGMSQLMNGVVLVFVSWIGVFFFRRHVR